MPVMTMRLAALGALPFLVAAFAFIALIPVVVVVAAAGLIVAVFTCVALILVVVAVPAADLIVAAMVPMLPLLAVVVGLGVELPAQGGSGQKEGEGPWSHAEVGRAALPCYSAFSRRSGAFLSRPAAGFLHRFSYLG
jgi:hypothetical protein